MDFYRWIADQRSIPSWLANFDSTTTLVRALARYLHGEDFPALGLASQSIARILPGGNRLPRRVRQRLYQYGTAHEAINPSILGNIDLEDARQWVVNQYPERGYPAVLVGSTNGAAVHLAALLGVPWLPQTFLLPVRRDRDPDAATAEFEWGARVAGPLLDANPDLALYHMFDPNQDRLPIQRMAYFRVKSLQLGSSYRQFLETVLSPDGVVLALDCGRRWPVSRVRDRQTFQFGGAGAVGPSEYHEGSKRIREFLARQNAARSEWSPPAPDEERPESEWGFDERLFDDVVQFTSDREWPVRRLSFDNPEDMSPFVARCYRDRYETAGVSPDRLVVDSFAQLDPWWTLRTASIPFWVPFTTVEDAAAVEQFLNQRTESFAEIYVSLFSHGVDSIGLTPTDRWRSIMRRATERGDFLGVAPSEFPVDYGSYVRYNRGFPETVPDRTPIVDPMSIERLDSLLTSSTGERIQWGDSGG